SRSRRRRWWRRCSGSAGSDGGGRSRDRGSSPCGGPRADGVAPVIAAALDLGDALSHIATALRVPVLIAAVALLLICALELGRFAVEWWRRWRHRRFDLGEVVAQAIADPSHAAHYAHYARSPITARALAAIAAAPAAARTTAT